MADRSSPKREKSILITFLSKGSGGLACRKIDREIDEQTLEIRAVEINGNRIGDGPVQPDLLGETPIGEKIGSVTPDDACDAGKCHDAVEDRGA